MTKDELLVLRAQVSELSSTTFYDNDEGGIQPAEHRVFNAKVLEFIDRVLLVAEAHADQKIADLVFGAPEHLNTLQELAIAINENEGGISTLINAIANKADKTVATHLANGLMSIADRVLLNGLPDALAGKAAVTHPHLWADITDKPAIATEDHGHSDLAKSTDVMPLATQDRDATTPLSDLPRGQFFYSNMPEGIFGQALNLFSRDGLGSSATNLLIASNRLSGDIYTRVRNGSNGAWSSWVRLLNSGNTIRGSVGSNGASTGGAGFTSAQQIGGTVRITHNLGHTAYMIVATRITTHAATDSEPIKVISKASTYCDVNSGGYGATGSNAGTVGAFDFIIMTY